MNPQEHKAELLARYPRLEVCSASIEAAYAELLGCCKRGGKLLIAGNGGSAADSEHIAAELMKSFLFTRKTDEETAKRLSSLYGEEGEELARTLESAIAAIPLTSMPALSTAFANDKQPVASFAQMVNGLGNLGDVFLGITTSGNSQNIYLSLMAARAKGMRSVLLTGGSGGRCAPLADVAVCVPEEETFKIQELHLPVYHALCAMLEAAMFEEKTN